MLFLKLVSDGSETEVYNVSTVSIRLGADTVDLDSSRGSRFIVRSPTYSEILIANFKIGFA